MSAQAKETWDKERAFLCEELENCFQGVIAEPLEQALQIGEADIVVGIPFDNEADAIGGVVETVKEGLREYFPD